MIWQKDWSSDELYIWNVTDEPAFVGRGVTHIAYGEAGIIEVCCLLASSYSLYCVLEGATVELVIVPIGPPDVYENGTPIIRVEIGHVEQWTDLREWDSGALYLNVVWEGKVELLDAGKV